MRRSSLAIAAALTSVALTTTAAVSFTGNGGGAAGAAPSGEPTARPSAVVTDPAVRSAADKADAVLTDADYVTREGDLSSKERKQVRAAAQDLRAMLEQARETPAAAMAGRTVAASRGTERTSLADRAANTAATDEPGAASSAGKSRSAAPADRSDAAKPAARSGGADRAEEPRTASAERGDATAAAEDPAADPSTPTNLAGATTGATSLTEQDTTSLPILATPLADVVDSSSSDRSEERAAAAEARDAAAAAPSAARIEKVTTSLQRLIAKADGDAVVSVKAGPTPEEIAAAKKAAEERRAAKAARAAEREAAQAAARAKEMATAAKSYGNGQIPASVLCGLSWAPGEQLRCDAAAALEDLNGAFRAAFGRNLDLTDGYRSYAEQVSVAASRGALAAVPGTSNHGLGQAVDLSGGIESFGSAEHAWMVANAGRYGWEHPAWAPAGGSKPEAWHWEYGTTY